MKILNFQKLSIDKNRWLSDFQYLFNYFVYLVSTHSKQLITFFWLFLCFMLLQRLQLLNQWLSYYIAVVKEVFAYSQSGYIVMSNRGWLSAIAMTCHQKRKGKEILLTPNITVCIPKFDSIFVNIY